jgi:methyl-accepting chemotaxis protein
VKNKKLKPGNFRLRHKLLAGFSVVILLLIVSNAVSFYLNRQMEQTTKSLVEDVVPVSQLTEDILTQLVEAQSSVRGYAISLNENDLLPYEAALPRLEKDLQEIKVYLPKYPELKSLLDNGRMLIDTARDQYREQIEAIDTRDTAAARAKVASATATIDGYRTIHKEIRREVEGITGEALRKSQEASERAKISLIILTLCAFILGSFVAVVLAGRISNPIIQVSEKLAQIARGDLTAEAMKSSSTDEIGQMVLAVNQMTDNLRTLIIQTKETSDQIASSAEEFSASTEEVTKSVQQVSAAVQSIAEGTDEQALRSQDATGMIQEIVQAVRAVNQKINETLSNSEHANRLVGEGLSALSDQEEKMKQNVMVSNNVSQVITELVCNVQEVGKILETISGIAAQTNLLALNAAVEAARAGEYGHGFAVVADEVRKLAEGSAQASEEIGNILQKIQGRTEDAAREMQYAGEIVEAQNIATQKTSDTFRRISQSVADIVERIGEIGASAGQIEANSVQSSDMLEKVSAFARQNAVLAQEASAGSEEQSATTQEIAASAAYLAQLGQSLQVSVAQFKI